MAEIRKKVFNKPNLVAGGKNKMKLDKFIGMMTGHFDNKEQFDMMQKAG